VRALFSGGGDERGKKKPELGVAHLLGGFRERNLELGMDKLSSCWLGNKNWGGGGDRKAL